MALGTILKVLLYLVLLLPAVIFVNQTINQYSSGATTYSEKQEPITLSDLPTIALCFDFGNTSLIYGVNVSITATLIERQNGTVILLENRNVSTVLGVEMHLSRFQLLKSIIANPNVKAEYQCFKITPSLKDSEEIDFKRFRMQLAISFPNVSAKCNGGKIYPSTEKNSYGLTHGRWFDGSISQKSIPIASWVKNNEANIWNYFYQISFTDITEINSLDYTCSEDSYYQCLAKRFANFDFRKAVALTHNKSSCNFEKICSPVSLPFEHSELPLCKNPSEQICYEKVLGTLRMDQDKYCQKSCKVKIYKNFITKYKNEDNHQNLFVLEFRFELPFFTWQSIMNKPFKTVKTEQLMISFLSLIGNIGGTLGMCVGFSLIGTSEWIMTGFEKLWAKIDKE